MPGQLGAVRLEVGACNGLLGQLAATAQRVVCPRRATVGAPSMAPARLLLNPRRPDMSERLLLRVGEVAERLGIGRSKTYELIAAGELPVVRVGRCVRVPAVAVRRWVEARCPSEMSAFEHES